MERFETWGQSLSVFSHKGQEGQEGFFSHKEQEGQERCLSPTTPIFRMYPSRRFCAIIFAKHGGKNMDNKIRSEIRAKI